MTVSQNDVLRATAEMSEGVEAIQNVIHFRSTNPATITDAQALIDMASVLDTLYANIDQEMVTSLSFDQVRVQNVTTSTLLGTTTWPVLTVGGSATALLPRQAAALITMPTSKPKTRGGVYTGGFSETNNGTGGTVIAPLLTNLIAVGAALLVERVLGPNSYRYVVFNTVLKTFVLPNAAIIPNTWRTQRRRRAGVGI